MPFQKRRRLAAPALIVLFAALDRGEVDELYARVDAVTAADARRVIKQHFPLENLVFTLIAKASEIAPLAKKYATDIQTKSITAPGF